MTKVWTPISVGSLQLQHRLAMAPMTRSRAKPDGTPGDLAATYYAQRASMGLLITEGTQPSEDGQAYLATPGIYTDSHVAGWRKVTDAVHAVGGRLFVQLMHVGRRAHPENTPHHRQPVAPSAIAPGENMFTMSGMLPVPEPRALTADEIKRSIADFARDAARAVEAGADGVEVHGANGYLVHQFLAPDANQRRDEYGGSVENRARFSGVLIVNRPGRKREQVGSDVAAGLADMESLGVMALANPDLVARLKTGAQFNDVRSHLFYAGGTAEGYIDYPALAAT